MPRSAPSSGRAPFEHIESTLPNDVPLIFAPVTSGKSLLDSIEERGRFPSPSVHWCTSTLKRGPIERELRGYLKAHPQFGGRLVNAMGMRAQESAARASKLPWKRSDRNSRAGRSWFDWLPIFGLTETQVFDVIRDAGQSPHPAYGMGMSRLSCVFCIMASHADLRTAARLQPALYRRFVSLEERIGHTLSTTRVPLPALTGVPVEPAASACRFKRRSETLTSTVSPTFPLNSGGPPRPSTPSATHRSLRCAGRGLACATTVPGAVSEAG